MFPQHQHQIDLDYRTFAHDGLTYGVWKECAEETGALFSKA